MSSRARWTLSASSASSSRVSSKEKYPSIISRSVSPAGVSCITAGVRPGVSSGAPLRPVWSSASKAGPRATMSNPASLHLRRGLELNGRRRDDDQPPIHRDPVQAEVTSVREEQVGGVRRQRCDEPCRAAEARVLHIDAAAQIDADELAVEGPLPEPVHHPRPARRRMPIGLIDVRRGEALDEGSQGLEFPGSVVGSGVRKADIADSRAPARVHQIERSGANGRGSYRACSFVTDGRRIISRAVARPPPSALPERSAFRLCRGTVVGQ